MEAAKAILKGQSKNNFQLVFEKWVKTCRKSVHQMVIPLQMTIGNWATNEGMLLYNYDNVLLKRLRILHRINVLRDVEKPLSNHETTGIN